MRQHSISTQQSTVQHDDHDVHIPYSSFVRYGEEEMQRRAAAFFELMNRRRSCRFLSSDPIPAGVLEDCIRVAGTSPSGAHTEPWTFVVVRSAPMKERLRAIVEEEERVNYEKRMGDAWVADLKPLGTSWQKEYITEAPAVVLVFDQTYGVDSQGERITHHYHEISIAICAGLFITALHNAGLATVTQTPLNAGRRIRQLCSRPDSEKCVLLLPIGFPKKDATVPNLSRKSLDKIMITL